MDIVKRASELLGIKDKIEIVSPLFVGRYKLEDSISFHRSFDEIKKVAESEGKIPILISQEQGEDKIPLVTIEFDKFLSLLDDTQAEELCESFERIFFLCVILKAGKERGNPI